MSLNQFNRRRNPFHQDPRIGRMVLLSLVIHLIVVLLFAGVLLPRFPQPSRPVYYVDLLNLPVKSPQAGRPQARPHKTKPAPRPEPKPPERTVTPPKPNPPAKVVLPPKPAPKPEPAPKPKPKPVEVKPKVPERSYQDVLKDIEARQREKKIEALKRRLAALAKNDSKPPPKTEAPVGMPEGHGDQKGIAYDAWVHDYLKKAWALSRYQVSNIDLSATLELKFDGQGKLVDYRFVKPSGDERFDQSVKKAILQLPTLPNPPGSPLTLEIVFNLKDLMD